MDHDRYETGLRIRREVVGDEYVEAALAGATEFDSDFQTFLTEYCWGAGWGRDGLDRATRSMLNIAMLSALGRSTELQTHIRGALRNGVTQDQIREVLIQVSIYCGVPAGVEGFRVARRVVDELRE